MYLKNPKNSDTKIAVSNLKFEQCDFITEKMRPKDADRMANSVDPDQTAPQGAARSWDQTAPQGAVRSGSTLILNSSANSVNQTSDVTRWIS